MTYAKVVIWVKVGLAVTEILTKEAFEGRVIGCLTVAQHSQKQCEEGYTCNQSGGTQLYFDYRCKVLRNAELRNAESYLTYIFRFLRSL